MFECESIKSGIVIDVSESSETISIAVNWADGTDDSLDRYELSSFPFGLGQEGRIG